MLTATTCFENLGNLIHKCRAELWQFALRSTWRPASGCRLWPHALACAIGKIVTTTSITRLSPGTLIYVKHRWTGDEPADILQQNGSPTFPHETRSDHSSASHNSRATGLVSTSPCDLGGLSGRHEPRTRDRRSLPGVVLVIDQAVVAMRRVRVEFVQTTLEYMACKKPFRGGGVALDYGRHVSGTGFYHRKFKIHRPCDCKTGQASVAGLGPRMLIRTILDRDCIRCSACSRSWRTPG